MTNPGAITEEDFAAAVAVIKKSSSVARKSTSGLRVAARVIQQYAEQHGLEDLELLAQKTLNTTEAFAETPAMKFAGKVTGPLAVLATTAEIYVKVKKGDERGVLIAEAGTVGGIGGAFVGSVGGPIGTAVGGAAGSFLTRKYEGFILDNQTKDPEGLVLRQKEYMASQWEARYDQYEHALTLGNEGNAKQGLEQYLQYLQTSLLNRGTINKEGFQQAYNYAIEDYKLAEKNHFHFTQASPEQIANHAKISGQSQQASTEVQNLLHPQQNNVPSGNSTVITSPKIDPVAIENAREILRTTGIYSVAFTAVNNDGSMNTGALYVPPSSVAAGIQDTPEAQNALRQAK